MRGLSFVQPVAGVLTSHVSKERTASILRGQAALEVSQRTEGGMCNWHVRLDGPEESRGQSAVFADDTRLLRMGAPDVTHRLSMLGVQDVWPVLMER